MSDNDSHPSKPSLKDMWENHPVRMAAAGFIVAIGLVVTTILFVEGRVEKAVDTEIKIALDDAIRERFSLEELSRRRDEVGRAMENAQEKLKEADTAIQNAAAAAGRAQAAGEQIEELRTRLDALVEGTNLNASVEQIATSPAFQDAVAAKVLPASAVIAVDAQSGCPSGWTQFEPANGRVIIGVGQGVIDKVGDQDELLTNRVWRESDGMETVALTVDQLPDHRHGIPYIAWDMPTRFKDGATGRNTPYLDVQPAQAADNAKVEYTNPSLGVRPTGGNQPHNNMPPYIALYFCKKD